MDDSNFVSVVTALMTDTDYQNVNVKTVDLWLLLSACKQMTVLETLHPPLREYYRDLGKRLQAIVVKIHPEAKELAARGWDTFVPADDSPGPMNPYEFWSFPHERDDEPYYGDEEQF